MGYNWRMKIKREYGIHYDQGDNYQNEISIPFSSIDPTTLNLIPKIENYVESELMNVGHLISKTYLENPKLNKYLN
jgi:hypothetical protein